MNPFLRSPKQVFVVGAVLLFVLFPVSFAGLVKVGANAAAHGPVGPLALIGFVLWAIVSFVLLLVGFAYLMIAMWMRVRLRTGRQVITTTRRSEVGQADARTKAEILRELTKPVD